MTDDEAAILAEAGITPVAPSDGEQGATGGVRYDPTKNGDFPEMLAFTAVLHRDGTVSGEYEYRSGDGLIRMHGPVTCLTVDADGTTAKFSGPVTQPIPDVEQFFQVVDNGEGPGSPPDEVTGPLSNVSACAKPGKVPAGFPVVQGNLQVHR